MVSVTALGSDFRKDDVLVLLGAGASVEAGIPHSATMVRAIEQSVNDSNDWRGFNQLYNYVRSAIFYAEGIRGRFGADVPYNIERLVEVLDELSRREEHPLYPFVGAWNPRLIQVAGDDFQEVSKFREAIVERLRRDWIEISDYEKARYFDGLLRFQKELNHPLRVFTLNYDLCVEKISQNTDNELPERGFDEQRNWKWQLFEESEGNEKRLFLYKMHGSIDWFYEQATNRLTYSDSTSKITSSQAALIFGTSYKLQYVDPFLFLVYEFRRWSLSAKLLVIIGYGFGDDHVNGILGQAIRQRPDKKMVVVSPVTSEAGSDAENKASREKWAERILGKLGLDSSYRGSICIKDSTAKKFLENQFSISEMGKLFPAPDPLFNDIKV